MRSAWVCLATVTVLAASWGLLAQEAPEPARPAAAGEGDEVVAASVKGSVEVRPKADQPWAPAQAGQKLGIEWEISTGIDGEAVLRFADNSEVIVKRLTEMKIGDFRRDEKVVKTEIDMKYGSLEVNVRKGTQANDFKVKSPTYSLSVAGTKIRELSFYKAYGGMVRMGSEGRAQVHVNPTLNIGAGQTTNDNLKNPIIFAKTNSWVPLNIPGYTSGEQNSNMFQGTTGAGAYDQLRSGNPWNSPLWNPVNDPDKKTPSGGSTDENQESGEEPW